MSGCATCGRPGWWTECRDCRNTRLTAEREARAARDRDFYQRTGHCGGCGNPGDWCQCTQPCGCARLHPVGSGVGVNPADVFAGTPVSDEQTELFDLPETGE